MELNAKSVAKFLGVFTIMVVITAIFFNFNQFIQYLNDFINIFNPFFVGIGIAYFFNVFMVIIENRLKKRQFKHYRMISFLITLITITGVLTFVLFNVIPNVVTSLGDLARNAQNLESNINDFITTHQDTLNAFNITIPEFYIDYDQIVAAVQDNYETLITNLSPYAMRALGGLTSFFIGLFFAFYLIFFKEKLLRQVRKLIYSIFPEGRVDQVFEVANLTNRTFSNFITGQCLEAMILGMMFTVTMTIFSMPYAMLVGSLVSVMALIPIVGAFISFTIGFFLILLVNPTQALYFAVIYLVLQQVEGNLIYPHVVGNSVGLPSIWTFASVVLGGSLMGILGIFLMIPTMSVLYTLLKKYVNARQKVLQVDPVKFDGFKCRFDQEADNQDDN